MTNTVKYRVSCFSVVILSEYPYDAADFGRQDVFDTIRAYLTSGQPPHILNSNNYRESPSTGDACEITRGLQ